MNAKTFKTKSAWRSRDPLYRGDDATAVRCPVPSADPSVVRHVLYLEGAGRETPYLSTTESQAVARRFAGKHGRVWATSSAAARQESVGHISHAELLDLLKGKGKGRAKWTSAFEVQQARRYVEQHLEHLLDFSVHQAQPPAALASLVLRIFVDGGPR
jgi:hypothetical protein